MLSITLENAAVVRLCTVCGRDMTGARFRSKICKACMKFFHRKRNAVPKSVCIIGDDNCPVDWKVFAEKGKGCTSCRLKKCIAMGITRHSRSKKRVGTDEASNSECTSVVSISRERTTDKTLQYCEFLLGAIMTAQDQLKPLQLNLTNSPEITDSEDNSFGAWRWLMTNRFQKMSSAGANYARALPGFFAMAIPDRCCNFSKSLLPICIANRWKAEQDSKDYFYFGATKRQNEILLKYASFVRDTAKECDEAVKIFNVWMPSTDEIALFQAYLFYQNSSPNAEWVKFVLQSKWAKQNKNVEKQVGLLDHAAATFMKAVANHGERTAQFRQINPNLFAADVMYQQLIAHLISSPKPKS